MTKFAGMCRLEKGGVGLVSRTAIIKDMAATDPYRVAGILPLSLPY